MQSEFPVRQELRIASALAVDPHEKHLDRQKTDVDVFERVYEGIHATQVDSDQKNLPEASVHVRGWLGGFVVSAVQVDVPDDLEK